MKIIQAFIRVGLLSTFLLVGIGGIAFAQDQDSLPAIFENAPQKVTINNIFVIGNEKTRKNIILRELTIQSGIEYDWEELLLQIIADEKKIYNLMLFNSVEITPLMTGTEQIELLVAVTERWYIIPQIKLNIADRNLAEWWTNQNRDLSRINFGAKLAHYNVGGRNEKLRVGGQLGFIREFEFFYDKPYIDKNQKHGLAFQFLYFTQKNLAVKSENNRQIFFTNENEDVLRRNTSAFLRYTYRGSFYNFHFVTFGYTNTRINEDVFTQNPNFFLHGKPDLGFLALGYTFRHDNRDNVAYPTQGQLLNVGLMRYGLTGWDDVQDMEFTLMASKYHRLSRKFHIATGASLNAFLGDRQPYTLVRGIGYNPYFIRGYELNVIEGQTTLVQKNSLRYNFLNLNFDLTGLMPIEQFTTLPFKFYLSGNFDHGFVQDRNRLPENLRLTNRYLFGYGLGLDMVTLHDMTIRFEYSINSMNEGALFINIRAPF
ncbi:MAG: BamA/TamA family outer membrane protein [Mongoliitalea sp.]